MYNIGKKRFVTKGNQRSERKEQTPNKREIRECRQEPKALNKLFRRATVNYCESIDDRWYQIRAIRTTKSKATEAEEKEKREELCKICQEPIQIYQGAPTKRKVRNTSLFKGRSWWVSTWNTLWPDERGAIIRCVKRYLGNCGNFSEWSGEKKQYQHAGERQIWHAKFTKVG